MLISLNDLETAYATTRPATVTTPLLEASGLARQTGAERIFVKAESLQVAGSFKIRGAYWRLTQLDPEERARGVVAYSSGNFAQGLAAAGAALGVPVTIVMPVDAPATKRTATEGYGAQVVLSEHGDRPREEAASDLASSLAKERGFTLLHPFDDPIIVAGQAGAGLEAIEQLREKQDAVDLVVCCVGGGGLIGGVALAFHYLVPAAEIVAVEPYGYDSMGESLRQAERTRVASDDRTICDALQATMPGAAAFEAAMAAGVRGVTVPDDTVEGAMRVAFDALKVVLEPSGAVALAAVIEGAVEVSGRRVLVYATGGNVSASAFTHHLDRAAQ